MVISNAVKLTEDLQLRSIAEKWPYDVEEASLRPPGPYTIENALDLIEEEPIELYNGWLVWKEMTDPEERRIASIMLEILSSTARTYHFGQGYMDLLECVMGNKDILIPDVSILSNQRFESQVGPAIPEREHLALKGSPELVIEVRSPSNLRHEERTKRRKYFENGALVIWDVEPKKHKIWVYELENQQDATEYGPNDTISCERLFPGWQRLVADFFSKELTSEDIVGQAAKEWRAESEARGRTEGRIEGKIEGRIEGKIEGRIEGRIEGELATLRMMLLLLVERRFGSEELPTDFGSRLEHYTAAQLTTLVATIATSPNLEEWLGSFPPL